MNSVEQTQNPMPDDGSMVPKESGKTGENLQTGSDAESREDVKSEWEQIIHSPKFHALVNRCVGGREKELNQALRKYRIL